MQPSTSQQIRHARYIDPSVPYHVVTKTFGDNLFAPKKGIQAKGTRRYMFLFNYDTGFYHMSFLIYFVSFTSKAFTMLRFHLEPLSRQ